MYIERVEHLRFENKQDYENKIKELVERFEKADFDYQVIESRYNSDENGYKAEIPYGFWVDNEYYDM